MKYSFCKRINSAEVKWNWENIIVVEKILVWGSVLWNEMLFGHMMDSRNRLFFSFFCAKCGAHLRFLSFFSIFQFFLFHCLLGLLYLPFNGFYHWPKGIALKNFNTNQNQIMARISFPILKKLIQQSTDRCFTTNASPRAVTLIPGDGVGPLVTDSVEQVMQAPVYFERYEVRGDMKCIPEEVIDSIKKNKVCLKGGLKTPVAECANEERAWSVRFYCALFHFPRVAYAAWGCGYCCD